MRAAIRMIKAQGPTREVEVILSEAAGELADKGTARISHGVGIEGHARSVELRLRPQAD